MDNPVLVEVTRGAIVESRHRGAFAVSLASGERVAQAGDVASPVYPRSAIKPFQALAAMAAGAGERFGLGADEVAVLCASHSGEQRHVRAVRSVLGKIGSNEGALECGAHWPINAEAARALARRGAEAGAIHNNCSGKHAGMLALARLLGTETAGYVERHHPVQQRILEVVEAFCGVALGEAPCGTDGCSVPTWAIPLGALARGFARFATGEGVNDGLAAAASSIAEAIAAEPFMIAGTGRFCSRAMGHTGRRALIKGGAEGVMCAALPERGLGIAVKCDDGAQRGAEVVMAHLLVAFRAADGDDPQMADLMRRAMRNAAGIVTGEIRAADALLDATSRRGAAMIA